MTMKGLLCSYSVYFALNAYDIMIVLLMILL